MRTFIAIVLSVIASSGCWFYLDFGFLEVTGIFFGVLYGFIFISAFIVPFSEKELDDTEKRHQEKELKKEQKAIKKERYVQKKCRWCNSYFIWADSGCRYHCSRSCEVQDH